MEGDQEDYSAVLNFMVGQMNLQVLTEKFLWFVISSPFMSIYTNGVHLCDARCQK